MVVTLTALSKKFSCAKGKVSYCSVSITSQVEGRPRAVHGREPLLPHEPRPAHLDPARPPACASTARKPR